MKLKGRIEPIIHFFIWGSFFFIVWLEVRTLGSFRKQDESIYLPMVWSTILNILLFYINALYLIPRFFSKHQYRLYFILLIVLYMGIVLINSIFDHFYAISLFSSEKESFFSDITLNFQTKTFILSLSLGYGLSKNWINSNKLQQQLVSDKLTTELKYLKAQINPHFLFNTLNMAYASAIKSNDEGTADIIEKLSGLMRYVLYESNEEKVLLEKEINYIDNYINLQMQRMSTELADQVKYEVKGNYQNLRIAPMILIPFIENVFKHGIMLSKKAEISILIFFNFDTLILETKNLKNSGAVEIKKENSGIGMNNVKERLLLLYPNQHHLEINNEEFFFRVRLEIKLKQIQL
ncbi:sensor histidine kinase [Flavobacterium sp. LB2P84]|uniref:Sensor histidine kinase n=1 Tax=Flavobacterium yafengii TaxID=3041253 RepID=A0AAW6TRD0_9FLAO|nr:sensor histidine kinase [Flavobacterium yafengii]MDI5950355.1 sensor histidine kinase [Flavobacterium yafengii]MDI6033738.1 sensor histidine kinase [Flavobacterium yafengii]